MMNRFRKIVRLSGWALLLPLFLHAQQQTDLLIVGGGASGTMAGIQAARMGVQTLIVEETTWLGGMLTSAGVAAIDGNHRMPSGLWGEFRKKLYDYYGGPDKVATGWVSNTLFEPHVGNTLLRQLAAAEKNLRIEFQTSFTAIRRANGRWAVTVRQGKKSREISARIVIDATELGDVMAAAGAKYSIGMDSRDVTGEALAPPVANNIIQDLTYVVVLKDYGKGADKTIPKPAGYDPAPFRLCCGIADPASYDAPKNNCEMMMLYGRLPNGKYMINWPKHGNDYYLNIIEKTPAERTEALKAAKLHTLRFVYYLQTELGMKHLGIAGDEFPTADKLPMIPYHRESRRVKGKALLTADHVSKPYDQALPLYRTGIAVGDYTIDHHHDKNTDAPQIDFVKMRVPSYNVPMGALVPDGVEGLIVAEKSIGVTNIVNGATRLQPVVMGIGQAAGALAAVALRNGTDPSVTDIRSVQQSLLDSKAYIMPFLDVPAESPHFAAIQRVGAAGVLRGSGVAFNWANQTWFYPAREVSAFELVEGLRPLFPELRTYWGASGDPLTVAALLEIFSKAGISVTQQILADNWRQLALSGSPSPETVLDRGSAAVLVDHFLQPFNIPVDFSGQVR
ncbi:FAD-dependent oxidoreductase [Chitinophaga rhizosphaerae]|uniref:FAD-dependent oxidoreductase n=1 Tax=Chitinophaga rhizosphaerae TaxID=1864947 RepID=UPI001F0C78AE|nr:FAD-dependent oxidoreductase [Chitinophaga rhizosphaerae]